MDLVKDTERSVTLLYLDDCVCFFSGDSGLALRRDEFVSKITGMGGRGRGTSTSAVLHGTTFGVH